MTTRNPTAARAAISHYQVLRRLDTHYGKFTLVSVRIETGRTHQIRVHLASLGHPVVGDRHYGAPTNIEASPVNNAPQKRARTKHLPLNTLALNRNFLHAAELEFAHPRTGELLSLSAPLPAELSRFLVLLESELGEIN